MRKVGNSLFQILNLFFVDLDISTQTVGYNPFPILLAGVIFFFTYMQF